MRPIRYVLLDEVDRYPASAGTEGDPVALAVKRSASWWNRKVLLVSTPTVKGASRIESWWLRSSQSSYWVPSPDCGAYQVLVWPQLEWPEGQPDAAQHRCAHCGVPVREWRRKKGVRGEVLDARTYACAALCGLVSMGLRLDAEADRIAALRPAPEGGDKTAAPTAATPARKVLRSRWLEAGLRRL